MEIDPSLGFTELPEEYFGTEDGQNVFSQGKQVILGNHENQVVAH